MFNNSLYLVGLVYIGLVYVSFFPPLGKLLWTSLCNFLPCPQIIPKLH